MNVLFGGTKRVKSITPWGIQLVWYINQRKEMCVRACVCVCAISTDMCKQVKVKENNISMYVEAFKKS
jgi:hypothetical protein